MYRNANRASANDIARDTLDSPSVERTSANDAERRRTAQAIELQAVSRERPTAKLPTANCQLPTA
jgi:hypothetical protein